MAGSGDRSLFSCGHGGPGTSLPVDCVVEEGGEEKVDALSVWVEKRLIPTTSTQIIAMVVRVKSTCLFVVLFSQGSIIGTPQYNRMTFYLSEIVVLINKVKVRQLQKKAICGKLALKTKSLTAAFCKSRSRKAFM